MNFASFTASLLALGLSAQGLHAQCATTFAAGDALAGTDDVAYAIREWDPDGAGPLPAQIIVAGSFSWIADIAAKGIASFDPATGEWSSMAGGLGGSGRAFHLEVLPSGELVVSGIFSSAGNIPTSNIATWDGQSWGALGVGLQNAGSTTIMPNGDLVAASPAANGDRLARWNGVSWLTFGSGMTGFVATVESLANGDLLVGGPFIISGATPIEGIARWNGSNWSPVGNSLPGYTIEDITVLPSGDIIAAGTGMGPQGNNISRFDGSSWQPLGSGLDGTADTLLQQPNGDLIVGGFFRMAGLTTINGIGRWNGTSWSPLAGGVDAGFGDVRSLAQTATGDVLAAGRFQSIGQTGANNIARFDGTSWHALVAGTNRSAACVTATGSDTYCVGGQFTSIGGVAANSIASWDGSAWSNLGSGCDNTVFDVVRMPNGDIIAGGAFDSAGGAPANKIARWDGATWSPLGSGLQSASLSTRVHSMAVLPDGRLVVGGDFDIAGNVAANNIAIWDGLSWAPLGPGSAGAVTTLLAMPNGDVVVDGFFNGPPAYRLARWDGASWQQLGSTPVLVIMRKLSLLPNGDIVANGLFNQIGGVAARNIARWDGSAWQPYGTGMSGSSRDSLALPNGDLLATGAFTSAGGVPVRRIARWDGSNWNAIGSGLRDGFGLDLEALPNGDVIVVGDFIGADGESSQSVARLMTSCPAEATAFGSGCTGTGGLNELTATTLPWLDASYELLGTGMPSNAFVVGVRGLTTTLQALGTVLPQGQAGCDLLVMPDLLDVYVPSNGEIAASFDIPNNSALIGQVLHHQLVPFAFGPNGSLNALTSSNALTLTIGTF
ncbi:MAG: hypothetical protein AB8H80_04620 [Planctomycetota bacterium]